MESTMPGSIAAGSATAGSVAAGPVVAGAVVRLPFRYLEWGPVFAGAIGAAAIAFVLYTFGSAIGLFALSPYPYRGLSGTTFWIVVTLYAAIVQVVAYAAGGYLAGRMRSPWPEGVEDERDFRDGCHGFAVWAIGLVLTAAVLASGAGGVLKTATEATSVMAAGTAGGAGAASGSANGQSSSGPSGGAFSLNPVDLAVDRLVRPAAATPDAAAAPADTSFDRAAVMRTLSAALRDNALAPDDRAYLVQAVARRTGLPQAEAERRVDQAFAQVQEAGKKARDLADQARKKGALAAFLTAATMALALAAACTAAGLGGTDRDKRTALYWLGARRFW
ncbi:MAG: hypothetical protein J0H77_05460 [Alphaproteobacteria bacterium]|nr:hypothetical protein [Alphaproteobacteria bacterium]|eukprot:Opistho-1_new@46123